MGKIFWFSFRLRNTYRANTILYTLKATPLLKRFLPSSLYASPLLKRLADILSGISEVFNVFFGKAIYFFFIVIVANRLPATTQDSILHILFFLTIIGGYMNTQIFNPTRDKFYALFCLRMDAQQYAVSNYLYFLLKVLVGFLACAAYFGYQNGIPLDCILAIPVFVLECKLICTMISLVQYEKHDKIPNENKQEAAIWIVTGILLIVALFLPYLKLTINRTVYLIATGIGLLPACLAMKRIFTFTQYKTVYRQLLTPNLMLLFANSRSVVAAAQQAAMQRKIDENSSITSNKSGYTYLNELFMKRHAKLLTKSAKRITLITLGIFLLLTLICYFLPTEKEDINRLMLTYLPYFLYIMYVINRGKIITEAMFLNCDHSMLTYRCFRQPKAILSLFAQRLKYVVSINLLPAIVIAVGLPFLLYITGGTDQPLNYVLLFVSILAMSVFFSVHNMVLYYLLQPYDINLENHSTLYKLANTITYIVCYTAIGKKLPTMLFGSIVVLFCISYILIALFLVYKYAYKTFKLRN